MKLITEACTTGARKHKVCDILGVSVRTIERWEKDDGINDKRKLAKHLPINKLTGEQRNMVLEIANSKEYRDLPPCKIVPTLADQGLYIASESTFYRILRDAKQLQHRHTVRSIKHHRPDAYSANSANQVWSWDITYLPTQVQGLYFYLYMIIDIYSRKIVGWSIHDAQCSEHSASLIKQACIDEKVNKDQLTLHSDNGTPMKGITMIEMLKELGVVPSFSRPSVSDDNPYSESLFKTLKYHPTFPLSVKFATIGDSRIWCKNFVIWYNDQHLHSALKFVTPQQRHSGDDHMIRSKRHVVYEMAKRQNPERWAGKTRDWTLPTVVTLNPDKKSNLMTQDKLIMVN
jgi:transposase InsO family protein